MTQHDLVLSPRARLAAGNDQGKTCQALRLLGNELSGDHKNYRMLSWIAHEDELLDLAGRRPNSNHDARILAVLAADPIVLMRKIARETQIAKSTVYNILV
jgi:DNA-binding MarR family transcriptional regulator